MHGIEEETDEEDLENETRDCPRCGEVALPSDRFCSSCGFAYDPSDAEEVDDAKRHAVERLKETGDPERIEEALEALVAEKVQDALSD